MAKHRPETPRHQDGKEVGFISPGHRLGHEQREAAAHSAANKIKQLLEDKREHVSLKVGVQTRCFNSLSHTLEYNLEHTPEHTLE